MIDLAAFIETIRSRSFFDSSAPVAIARAPGRLDVMGGIADYSGSLVLQRPIAEATFAAAQLCDAPVVQAVSVSHSEGEPDRVFVADVGNFVADGHPIEYGAARERFRFSGDHWAAYVVGALPVLMREKDVPISCGLKMLIASSVPEGKGVASSAALEVASMQAIVSALGTPLPPSELAILCQKVENLIAAAPCGLMDQMASSVGEADSLMAMLCQPADLQASVRIPKEISFWGLDSGERHAVTGTDYIAVRTGAFMGYRLIAGNSNLGNGYLANLSPEEFERDFLHRLPEQMSGDEFLKQYRNTTDTVTKVDPERIYPLRHPTAHPIYEHDRVKRFRDLLLGPQSEEQWTLLGQLMYQSHASYSACGLGSWGTDAIVRLVQSAGPSSGLYGARITGGGSGGTVVILGRRDAERGVSEIAAAYNEKAGHVPHVFSGTSPGAATFGTVSLNL